jgi:hypothetical protein
LLARSLAAPDDAEEMVNAMAHILFEGQGTLSKVFKVGGVWKLRHLRPQSIASAT